MRRFALAAVALALSLHAPEPDAQIVQLTLPQMMDRADHAVFAEVVEQRVFTAPDPDGGGLLYFTTLVLEGRSLVDGRASTVEVSFPGGFLDEDHGTWNSEAPDPGDIAPGQRVVAFYRWVDDMGGGVPGNVLYGFHGGLFRTVVGPDGRVVLGRGAGYAISTNRSLDDLDAAVTALRR